jgi:hypothetical protein
MTTIRNENGKTNNTSMRKEKIINAIFTKKDLNRIDNMLNEDNYTIYYLWSYLDERVNELVQNQKDFKNFSNEEIKEIFSEFSQIIKEYYNNYEYKDPQKQKECKLISYLSIFFLIKISLTSNSELPFKA